MYADFTASSVSHVQNKVFIFRGQEYEKLADFNTRLSSQFPSAKVFDHDICGRISLSCDTL